jgi:hypothetical protein
MPDEADAWCDAEMDRMGLGVAIDEGRITAEDAIRALEAHMEAKMPESIRKAMWLRKARIASHAYAAAKGWPAGGPYLPAGEISAVHGMRRRGTPVLTLVAFANAPKSEQMCDIVFSTAAGTGSDVVQMDESDISEDLALFIAAKAHASPETGVLVVPGGEWDLDGAGREVAHRSRTMDS